MYDLWLGGTHHSPADRTRSEQITLGAPHLPYVVRTHRAFSQRVVRYLVDAGVRQFLDLGSGLPTMGNVHQTARGAAADCRVVYVDNDPAAVVAARCLLGDDDRTAVVQADLRDLAGILDDPGSRRLLDPTEPLAVLMVDVLHFVPEADDPGGIVSAYARALPPGGYLAISHTSRDPDLRAGLALAQRIFRTQTPSVTLRGRQPVQIVDFVVGAGLEVVPPGVVPVPLWHPEPAADNHRNPENFPGCAALGRKP